MSEGMARQLGNYIGQFIEYDANVVTRGIRNFMRIRVLIDVRKPLKRKKKIAIDNIETTYVFSFQYEKLSLFCYLCERLGHGEGFCPVRLTLESQEVEFGWANSIRVIPRGREDCKWLREDKSRFTWMTDG